jgi:hypothetical protein
VSFFKNDPNYGFCGNSKRTSKAKNAGVSASIMHDFKTEGKPSAVTSTTRKVTLESLSDRIPVIPEEAVGFYKHNCMVCFQLQGHQSGVILKVLYKSTTTAFEIAWAGEITEQLLRAYRETTRATDFAACTIALILVRELTEFTAVEQSCIGTTIDYYLIPQRQNDDLIFNHAARLEVSGILAENEDNRVDDRIKQKVRRLKPEGDLPDFIAVVEFSKPWSKMVEA